ncbi:HAD-like protein [Corynespora cassiicola Philippines]|uniref:HAD-like protein n=1 Tax=Corynespora cassiicola Philippines TaxID=1448308 RepID=A0A2T2N397_CORCC|nr:HAD-like protein [Corynespora cassiicola Philippines]
MISLVTFDLDGTLALSKQPLLDSMGEALADLLHIAHVAFEKQIVLRLPARADRSKLWLLPTTGTNLYTCKEGQWDRVCANLFNNSDKERILEAFDLSLEKTGSKPEKTWGNRIEDRGDLMQRLPEMSINIGGATSIDITQKGADKAYSLKRLGDQSGIPLEEMILIGDAIFPGGNDYPAHQLGLKAVKVKDPDGTLAAIAGIHACLGE